MSQPKSTTETIPVLYRMARGDNRRHVVSWRLSQGTSYPTARDLMATPNTKH